MRRSRLFALPVLLAALALPAAAQDVGSTIPEIELEGYSQTGAESFDDFYGRAVLFEFFAYW
jgi:hypothetical protein